MKKTKIGLKINVVVFFTKPYALITFFREKLLGGVSEALNLNQLSATFSDKLG